MGRRENTGQLGLPRPQPQAPSSGAGDGHERRFLDRLALGLIPLALLVGSVMLPRWLDPEAPQGTMTFKVGIGVALSALLTLWLNHRGHFWWAARFFIITLLAAPLVAAMDRPEISVFLFVSVLVATALFSAWGAVAVGALGLLGQGALLLRPGVHLDDLVLSLCVNTVLLPLLFIVQGTHRQLDRLRLAAAQHSERWFATTLSSIGDAVLTTDTEGRVTFMNPVAARLTGWSAADARGAEVGRVFRIVHEKDGEPAEDPVRRVLREGQVVGLANHTVLLAREGGRHPIADSGAPILDDDGKLQGVVLVFRDMSDEQSLREQLDRARRLESLGRLAGGVAHDFNNLLTVIGGGLSLALSRSDLGPPPRADLQDVQEATRRAVGLTGQLLAFSRRQVMQPRVLDINAAVRDSAKMVRRILRENVELEIELDEGAGRVLVDPVQLEQVLLNLAINGADAMPDGGRLTLKTDALMLGPGSGLGLQGGSYVRLRVSDTGCGMDQLTRERAFEPFFSTKEPGRGTGLGLSTVDGIVQQSGGVVGIDSQPGRGTTFTILLPRTSQPARITGETEVQGVPTARPDESSLEAARPRTILIVEDDAGVRKLASLVLDAQGYRILAAASGSEALALRASHAGAIDLLITDLVMPGMSGSEVARAFRAQTPPLPVLFMSGYADEVVAHDGMNPEDGAFLAKPFTPASLVATVRSVLGR